MQRTAPGPAAVNEGPRHFLADLLYSLIAWVNGSETQRRWQVHTDQLAKRVLEVARRDPGCRVLVVVNARHCHHIRHALRQHPEVQEVRFTDL